MLELSNYTLIPLPPPPGRIDHPFLTESYTSARKVLNQRRPSKKERHEPSSCCHDNKACYLDKDFGNLLKEWPENFPSISPGKDPYLSADCPPVVTGKMGEERDDLWGRDGLAWECQGRGKLLVENTGSHSSGSLLLHLGNPKVTDSKASSCVKTPNCHRWSLQETNATLIRFPFY